MPGCGCATSSAGRAQRLACALVRRCRISPGTRCARGNTRSRQSDRTGIRPHSPPPPWSLGAEEAAVASLNGAFAAGLGFSAIEAALAAAALEHYNDFWPFADLPDARAPVDPALGAPCSNRCCGAGCARWRWPHGEDLLPQFGGYVAARARWETAAPSAAEPPSVVLFEARSVGQVLEAALSVRTHPLRSRSISR